MKTNALVYARTHSATIVTDYIMKTIKQLIVDLELNIDAFNEVESTYEHGIETWLDSNHLEHVTLEIYYPYTNRLIGRFDFTIRYDWGIGDSIFWADKNIIKDALQKAGINPKHAQWDILLSTKHGSPPIPGWVSCEYRPTWDMEEKSMGLVVEHNKLSADFSYWRTR